MNDSDAKSSAADRPLPDPNGDPAEDRAAGFAPDDASDPAWRRRQMAILGRLGDVGVAVAEELPALARAQSQLAQAVTERLRSSRPEGIAALGELAVTLHKGNVDFAQMYERICRSVRRCIALQMQIASAPRRASAPAGPREAAARSRPSSDPEAQAERDRRAASERPSGAESGNAAGLEGEFRAERLLGDLYDRPEDPTGMADLGLDRPMAALVAEICADFGVDGRFWAEQLGIDIDAAGNAAAAAGKMRAGAGRHRPDRATRAEIRRPGGSPGAAPPTAPPSTARPATDVPVRREPPDPGDAAAPDRAGNVVHGGLRVRKRREQRAQRKLLGRKPSSPAHRTLAEPGRGPP